MKITSVADAKAKLSTYLEECQDEPVIITRNGKPTAVLVPIHEGTAPEDLERLVLAYHPRFRQLLEQANERIERGEGIQAATFWAELNTQ
jgi:prevent-host-death family protein